MPPSLAEIRQLGGWEQGYPARSLDCSARGWVSTARGGGGLGSGSPRQDMETPDLRPAIADFGRCLVSL